MLFMMPSRFCPQVQRLFLEAFSELRFSFISSLHLVSYLTHFYSIFLYSYFSPFRALFLRHVRYLHHAGNPLD